MSGVQALTGAPAQLMFRDGSQPLPAAPSCAPIVPLTEPGGSLRTLLSVLLSSEGASVGGRGFRGHHRRAVRMGTWDRSGVSWESPAKERTGEERSTTHLGAWNTSSPRRQ